jgi:uncharacterized 2Fe-2S/4Fe-4S cluster protein (DUF4445 family)
LQEQGVTVDDKTVRIWFQTAAGDTAAVSASLQDTLLETAHKAGIAIDAPCSGGGTCGKCKIRLTSGELISEHSRHLTDEEYEEGYRLACQSRPASDIEVFVPASSIAFSSRIRVEGFEEIRTKAAFDELRGVLKERGLYGDHGMSVVRLFVDPPGQENPIGDRERLFMALEKKFGDDLSPEIRIYALRKLPAALRAHGHEIYCLLRTSTDRSTEKPPTTVIDVWPAGERSSVSERPIACGLAVDIGTTSISALLTDLATGEIIASGNAGNAQVRYGADVIGRIIESGRPGGSKRLQDAVIADSLSPLLDSMCEKVGLGREAICRVAVAGNTTMAHLFTGVPAQCIRLEPYVPAFFESGPHRSGALGLGIHPEAEVWLAPAVGSYVGGDITAGVYASMMSEREDFTMLIDLGTNGELVFGNRDFLMTCACSAGPAFEGGNISCGMRATAGAVEACRVDETTMIPSLTVIGGAGALIAGVCGSGLIDLISGLFAAGIINAKGKIVRDGDRIWHGEWGYSGYIVAFAAESETGRDVILTETDIDNFIRAKGAIFSAIRTMFEIADIGPADVSEIFIAGGIGGSVDIAHAIAIGMLPDIPPEHYRFIGNSSLSGAYGMLISDRGKDAVTDIGRKMTYLELSAHARYMDEFVAACFLPHTDASLFPSATSAHTVASGLEHSHLFAEEDLSGAGAAL